MSATRFSICFLSCLLAVTFAGTDSENGTVTLITSEESVTTSKTGGSDTPASTEYSSSTLPSVTSNDTPEIVGPPSRTYFRNVLRVSSARRNGRTFTNGENTIESPLRPTASAQEYPRGTGVGSYAEVGMAATKTATDRTGRSFLGSTEASVSDSCMSLMSSMSLILIPLLTPTRFGL